MNNLKQLALGCLNYESANKTSDQRLGQQLAGRSQPQGRHHAAGRRLFNILPYIEESHLYKLQEGNWR